MAQYTKTSPWYKTKINDVGEMGILNIRPVPAEDNDILYKIEPQYNHRPDLLAYDLYGSHKLWWVFAQRNMDILLDPIYDFEPGVEIYLPKSSSLKKVLGL
jgi:hypothetical protein